MNAPLDPIAAVQVIAAAIAGFLAGRGRVRRRIDELERENDGLRTQLTAVQAQLEGAIREQQFTNALVVQLVGQQNAPRRARRSDAP